MLVEHRYNKAVNKVIPMFGIENELLWKTFRWDYYTNRVQWLEAMGLEQEKDFDFYDATFWFADQDIATLYLIRWSEDDRQRD